MLLPLPSQDMFLNRVFKWLDKCPNFESTGFVTFTVAFFGVSPSLPKRYTTIDIEYFEKAINFVCKKFPDDIDSSSIGMMGISKGLSPVVT